MQLIEKIAPFYIVFILLEAIYSFATKRKVYSLFDTISDIATGTISRLVDVLVLTGAFFCYEAIRGQIGINLFQFDFSNPFQLENESSIRTTAILSWLFVFILADLVFYTYHRVSHEVNFFWASHIVHHSSEEFNLSVALRQTMFRNLFYFLFAIPLAVINIPWEVVVISDALNRTYQFTTHTRLISKFPAWIEYIFVTPSHHRVHHAVNPNYIDKNYAGVFILWDRIFRSFAEEKEEPVYGITKALNSYNPLWANFHAYKDIWMKILDAKSFYEFRNYLFSYPGWTPGIKTRDLSIQSRNQFNNEVSRRNKIILFIIFGLIVISSLIFIRLSPDMSIYTQTICIVLFLITFGLLGSKLDQVSSM